MSLLADAGNARTVPGTDLAVSQGLDPADLARLKALLEKLSGNEATPPPKGIDQFIDRISKASTFLSTVLIAGLGLVFTYVNNAQQEARIAQESKRNAILEQQRVDNAKLEADRNLILRKQQADDARLAIMRTFVEPVVKRDTRFAALNTIAALGHADLALNMAGMYPEDGHGISTYILSAGDDFDRAKLRRAIDRTIDYIEKEIKQITVDITSRKTEIERPFHSLDHRLELLNNVLKKSKAAPIESVRDLKRIRPYLDVASRDKAGPMEIGRLLEAKFVETFENVFFAGSSEDLKQESQTLIDRGRGQIANFRVYEGAFSKKQIFDLDQAERRLEALKGKLDLAKDGEVRKVFIELIDFYIDSHDRVLNSEREWEGVRKAFEDFTRHATRALADHKKSPSARQGRLISEEMDIAYRLASQVVITRNAPKVGVIFENVRSVYAALDRLGQQGISTSP